MIPSHDQPNPAQALRLLRIIWNAAMASQIILAILVDLFVDPNRHDGELASTLLYTQVAALALLIPTGYFVRNQIYKANWVGHAITPRGYVTANLALFALVETVSFAAVIGALFAHDDLRPLIVFCLALVVLSVNFPTGKPMRATPPGQAA